MNKNTELKARYDHAASFYGKAKVIIEGDTAYLRSYNTIVCSIDKNGTFRRHWGGYSATTMRHVNEFMKQYGLPDGGKKFWESQEVVNW